MSFSFYMRVKLLSFLLQCDSIKSEGGHMKKLKVNKRLKEKVKLKSRKHYVPGFFQKGFLKSKA